jgi:type I site-specific restriction endonuclease
LGAGLVKKAAQTVKKVLKNPLVRDALNAFGKWITKDKKSNWGDNVNKTTRMIEDTYNTFTKQMEEPEEPPSRIEEESFNLI